jgi:hypothetical protein
VEKIMIKSDISTAASAGSAIALATVLACGFMAPAQAGEGWQPTASFTFTAGETSQFLHEDCPKSTDVAVMGAFEFNSVGQTDNVNLGYNGPRLDTTPVEYYEWGWHFAWPAGAKAGETANFAIYCVSKEGK